MKKIITSFIALTAIATGLAVGHGTVRLTSVAYGSAVAYVSEIKTNLAITKPLSLGGQDASDTYVPIEHESPSETPATSRGVYLIAQSAQLPAISSESFIVADVETGKVLASKDINEQRSIASITKLMTSLVAEDMLGLDHKTVVTQRAVDTYGTQGDIQKDETYLVSELLHAVLLESSNDAAEVLALADNRSAFIKTMNDKAASLGLINTEYDDASGLSQYNVSTVADLFKLTQYIYNDHSYIFDITTKQVLEIGDKTWRNNSRFRNDPAYVGGKNGYTDAARKTQIALFEHDFEGQTRTLAYIVLGSDDVGVDINMLRGYIRKNVKFSQ